MRRITLILFAALWASIAVAQLGPGTGVPIGPAASGGGGGGGGGGSTTIVSPQGRLTLQSATPVQTSDQTGVSTIYYDCFTGGDVPYYTGGADALDTIASCQLSLTLEASGTGVENASDLFDIWWWHNSGTPVLCVATNGSGGGWASDTSGSLTARGTGYSQLDFTTRSYITNKNALSHCYGATTDYGSIPANEATYLGTFYTTAAGQTGVALHPSSAAGGTNNIVGLSNGYNRQSGHSVNTDSTTTWTNGGSTWGAADASNSNRISFVDGLQRSPIKCIYNVRLSANFGTFGCDLDSTSATPGSVTGILSTSSWGPARVNFFPQLGFHFIQAMENGNGGTPAYNGGIYEALELDIGY